MSTGCEIPKWAAWLHAALSYIPPTQHISIAAAEGSGQGHGAKENLEEQFVQNSSPATARLMSHGSALQQYGVGSQTKIKTNRG